MSVPRFKSQFKIRCICRVPGKVPSRRSLGLARRLYKKFAQTSKVKRSKSMSREFNDLSVIFVGKTESHRLNKLYRKKNYATDVLSFAPEAKGEGLGEIVLCLPVLKRQAKKEKHSLNRELDTLLIHGFLHLLGYDHEKSRKEELKMMRLQDKLLESLT